MTIGSLYNANNVIVGQAAVLFAPVNTPLITLANFDVADPFDFIQWYSQTLVIAATATFTLKDDAGHTSSSLTQTSTGANIATALNAFANGATYAVSGSAGGPYVITITAGTYHPISVATVSVGTAVITLQPWVPVGATDQGWKYGTNKSVNAINIEEQSTQVATTISSQSVTIEGSLSEDITQTLALAYNGLVATTAPGVSNPGYDVVSLTDTVLTYAVAMVTTNPQGLGRIIYAPQWTQLSNVSTDFRRASAKRMYPVQFATICKPSQIQVVNFTLPHT